MAAPRFSILVRRQQGHEQHSLGVRHIAQQDRLSAALARLRWNAPALLSPAGESSSQESVAISATWSRLHPNDSRLWGAL